MVKKYTFCKYRKVTLKGIKKSFEMSDISSLRSEEPFCY